MNSATGPSFLRAQPATSGISRSSRDLSRSSSTTSSSAMIGVGASSLSCDTSGTAMAAAASATVDTDHEKTLECPLCLTVKPWRSFPYISTCSHRSCLICIKHYLRIEISEARTNICCPGKDCCAGIAYWYAPFDYRRDPNKSGGGTQLLHAPPTAHMVQSIFSFAVAVDTLRGYN